MVLDKKFVDEFPAVHEIHRQIPNRRDGRGEKSSPNRAEQKFRRRNPPHQHKIKPHERVRKSYADQAFGQQRDSDKYIKKNERQKGSFARTPARIIYKERAHRRRYRKGEDDVETCAA